MRSQFYSTNLLNCLFTLAHDYLCDVACSLFDEDLEFIDVQTEDRILNGIGMNKKVFLLVDALTRLVQGSVLNSLHESSLNLLMCLLDQEIQNECFNSENGVFYRKLAYQAWCSNGRKQSFIESVQDDEDDELSADEIEFFERKWNFDKASFWQEFVIEDLKRILKIDDGDFLIASAFPATIEGCEDLKKNLGIDQDYIQVGVPEISDDKVQDLMLEFTFLARKVLPKRKKYKKSKHHYFVG